jgi:catecholate siderophore receptor
MTKSRQPAAGGTVSLRPAPAHGTILAGALAAAFLPAAAFAEEAAAGSQRSDIIVEGHRTGDANPNADPEAPYKVDRSTDSRFSEEVRDTPKSITIIPKEVIEDVGATSFRELARTTPGVTLGTGEGGNAFGDRIFIRGFEARNDIYIDGQRDPGVTSREVFAIEQIEIVKGPSSAFMGRGTTGGSVGLQSKRAQTGNDFLVAEGGIGTENFRRGTVDANYEMAPGLALRVNGLYHSADVPGRDFVDSERYGVAGALGWRASDTLSFALDYYHFRSDGMSDYGHPFDPATREPYAVDADNFYGVVGRDFLENDADVGTFAVQWQPIEALTLHSQTRYGEVDNRYVVSVPRAPRAVSADSLVNAADLAKGFVPGQLVVDTGSPQRNATTEYLGNITTVSAALDTGGITHALVFGGEFSKEKVTNRRYVFPAFVENEAGTQIGTPSGFTRDLFDPDPVLGYRIPALLDPAATPTVTEVESWSIFAIDTIKFSPRLELLFGGRFDTFEVTTSGSNTTGPYRYSGNFSFFNGQASLLYKPVEAMSLYASYATSANPSGEQLDSTSPTYGGLVGVQNLEPERNKAYELGAKWEVADGHLLLTAAAFRIDKTNARENLGGGVYANVGKQRSQGFELGVNGNITSRWSVYGGYTYLDATVQASQANPASEGRRFANVPRHSFSLLSSYALTDKFAIGAQAYYRSRIYGGNLEANDNSVPGYWKFDAVARYRPTDTIELRANVLNIFDKRYYDAIYRSGTPFSYVAPGRSATLSVSFTM